MKPTSKQLKELLYITNENEITINKSIVDNLYLEYTHLEIKIKKAIKLLDAYIGVLDDTSDLYFENVKSILEATKVSK